MWNSFAEANRDDLDWSGRKPLDYRKQSTSISASTYSSKYGGKSLNNYVTPTAFRFGSSSALADGFGTFKFRKTKRFSTMNGIMRSHSMKGAVKPTLPIDSLTLPKRATHFSPELDHDKRNNKYYRSILFRKKPVLSTKP